MDHSANQNRPLLFYTLCLAYIATGMVGMLSGPALIILAAHTHVALDTIGWIFSTSSLGFTAGVLAAGNLSERISAKYILMGGILIQAIGAVVVPWTDSFLILLIASFLMGLGGGFIDISINILATLAFHDTLSETLNNIHSAFGIGALLGPLLLSITLTTLHNPIWAFLTGAILCVITAALLLPQFSPKALPRRSKSPEDSQSAGHSRRVLTQVALWLMASQLFLYVGGEIGLGDWMTTAISKSANVPLALAAPAATMYWLGLALGRLLSAQVLKRQFINDHQMLYICIIGGGLSALLVAIFPGIIWLSFSASLLAGLFFGPIFPGVMALASRRFVHDLSTTSSVMMFSGGASGLVFPVVIGAIISHIGIGWGMTVPALTILIIIVPFFFSIRGYKLPTGDNEHTPEPEISSTVTNL
jgi:fucose permease